MTYPSPSEWQDPARSDPSSAPPVDPTRSMTDPPVPAQPAGVDPYSPEQPAGADPYIPAQPAGADPYVPVQPTSGQPVADAYGTPGYAAGYPTPGYAAPGHPPAGYPPAGYPPAGYPAYPYPPARRTNTLALVALIMSLVGIASCATAPVGAILGHVAQRQIRETGEDGEGMAKAAIIVGWVLTGLIGLGVAIYVAVIVFAVSQSGGSTY
ncbi:protein of unknown function [Micromonospora pallida]|uniref:DUF4190 domain-containing protein n=1 Tax=Micromonospora pallida TaxID=145854 RepID=A0A1C6T4A3_9ACTN|nr:DUF4190 domain-containing protein [Micromonospora pallida]SCL36624.1 protein of unknown function [Micromonospora pallida]